MDENEYLDYCITDEGDVLVLEHDALCRLPPGVHLIPRNLSPADKARLARLMIKRWLDFITEIPEGER